MIATEEINSFVFWMFTATNGLHTLNENLLSMAILLIGGIQKALGTSHEISLVQGQSGPDGQFITGLISDADGQSEMADERDEV